jgi:uncharacterized membrane protein YoaK (UPF0700 family)
VQRHRLLLLGLTVVAASTDAISYLGLGHVFPANMTGNTVLLGVGLATGDPAAAAGPACALGAFVLGAGAAAALTGTGPPSRGRFALVLGVEVALLAALSGWWLAIGVAIPAGAARYGLIVLAGLGMGAQSALVRALDVPVSTTYITGTWTGLAAGVAAREAASARSLRLAVVATYLVAACLGALAHRGLGAAAAIPPSVLALVLLAPAGTRAMLVDHARRDCPGTPDRRI